MSSFDQALEFQPDSAKVWDKRGYTLIQLGRDEEAIASFDQALKIKPDYAVSYYNKAACYALQKQADLAVQNLQEAMRLNPQYREEVLSDIDFTEIKQDAKFQNLVK
jgi:tetratricopeptide (TPR) repeat protein